ncbi:MAG: ATP-binding protein [Actinomycetota bacterium]|nr:ATP-binding protein [Actinomycetota bacterium]
MSSLREAIVVLDADNRVVEWLGGAERLLGWNADEMLGQTVEERLAPSDVNGNRCCIGGSPRQRRMRIVKGTPEQEMLVLTRNGSRLWVGVTCSFERDARGRVVGATAVFRDIARRKRVDLAKSEVISAVAHELRSPLTSVKGFTSTLLSRWDRFDEETKKRLLVTIDADTDRVTRLIGELLDVSRLEAGRLHLTRRMIQVADIASRVIERMRPRAANHEFEHVFPDEFPEVYADSDKIEQVLTNLIENALKYTDGGRVAVTGRTEDSVVRIAVSDEGEGIPTEQRFQVFNKFYRHGGALENPGTGLGLYISKGLIEAHGGRIWVEEAPGGGAEFAFTLPRGEAS